MGKVLDFHEILILPSQVYNGNVMERETPDVLHFANCENPTAHGHPLLKACFSAEKEYAWPDPHAKGLGFQVDPLYRNPVEAVKKDEVFYALLALTDVLRVGKVREVQVASDELKKRLIQA